MTLEILRDLLTSLMITASSMSNLPVPPELPHVEFVNDREMWGVVHPNLPYEDTDNMEIAAAYHPEIDTIYLLEDMAFSSEKNQSYVLHEFVHFVEDYHGVNMDCAEKRAYPIQEAWLNERGMSLLMSKNSDGSGFNDFAWILIQLCRSESGY